jgi:CcmD family protein
LSELLGHSVGERIAADFVVLAVALVTWAALFVYLVRLDRKLRGIEKR